MNTILFFLAFSVLAGAGSHSQQSQPVTLLFGGDMTLARHIEREVGDKVDYLFERWKGIEPYDVFMVNLENPVTLSTQKVDKEFNFRMHPRYLRALQRASINIVNLANNHVGDYGLAGLYDSMANLDSVGIRHVGAGRTLGAARSPVVIEKNGRKIGFLGYYGGGRFSATSSRGGVAPRYEPYILSDVRQLRGATDYVVVSLHWGDESADRPSPDQIRLAHRIIDAGADLIIGHHSHTLQGIERYKEKVIAYSLGNFIFGGNGRSDYETAVLRLVLRDSVADVELIPIQVTRWQPHLPNEVTRLSILNLVRERSRIFSESISLSSGASQ